MHTSKDSMWRGIWKILQNFLELIKAEEAGMAPDNEMHATQVTRYIYLVP